MIPSFTFHGMFRKRRVDVLAQRVKLNDVRASISLQKNRKIEINFLCSYDHTYNQIFYYCTLYYGVHF